MSRHITTWGPSNIEIQVGEKYSISLIKVQVKGRNQNGRILDVGRKVINDANIAYVG